MADDLGLKSSELARKLRTYGAIAGPTAVINVPFSRDEAQAFVDVLEYLDTTPAMMEAQRAMYDEKIAAMQKGVRAHILMLVWETVLASAVISTLIYFN